MPASTRLAPAGFSLLLASVAHADPVYVTDQTGRTITLEKPAERIVTLPMPSAAITIALDGGTERLVGMHPLSKAAIEEAILGELFPEARNIASDIVAGGGDAGFMPNVEAVAALNPDVVIQWGDRTEDVIGPLTNAGLTTALVLYGDEAKGRDYISLTGALIGKPDKAKEIIAWRDETAAEIGKIAASIPEDKKPRVLYLLRAQSELRAAGSGTFNDYYIGLTGGRNVAAEISGFKAVNAEQIAAWNPDIILLNGFEAELDVSRIYDDPVLGVTNAATEKRVYKMPIGGYRWDPPSQESPLTWMWLAELMHPDLFDYDLRGKIAEWYAKLYGKTPSLEQIDAILRMRMNGSGANYARFAAAG